MGWNYLSIPKRKRLHRLGFFGNGLVIGIGTNIEVIVVSLTTWEAHRPRAVVSFPSR